MKRGPRQAGGKALRISDIELAAVDLQLDRPLRTAIHEISTVSCLLLTVRTDEGVSGEGYGFCFGIDRLRSIAQLAASLKPKLIGRDPFQVEALWSDLFRHLNFCGQAGLALHAMTPIDVACWDIIGKVANQPLYRLFGAHRDRVPVYASGGLWLSSGLDELRQEARAFVDQGFKAMKLRLGSPRWQDDIARIEAVRDAIGPDIGLMVDANQGLTPAHALRLGRALEAFELVWFEEPVPTWNDEGSAALAAALDTPIASGETEYTRYGLKRQIQARAADILMPDLQRMGGYTEFRKAIGLMAAHDVPFSPHIFTEHSLHLVASSAGAIYAEHMPWFGPLFREAMAVETDGTILVPDRPGVGFTFDWDRLDPMRAAL